MITSQSSNSDPDATPPWFTKFANANNARLDVIQANGEDLKFQFAQAEEHRIAEAEARRKENTTIRNFLFLKDPAEILVIGLPADSPLTPEVASLRLMTSLNLPPAFSAKFTFRDWTVHAAQRLGTPPDKRFVIRLPGPNARDTILERASLLKNRTANDVFGCGGTGSVFLQALWPHPVHQIYSKALRESRARRFPRPIVSNLVVGVRPDRSSDFTPLLSLEDTDNFFSLILPHLHSLSITNPSPCPSLCSQIHLLHSSLLNLFFLKTLYHPPCTNLLGLMHQLYKIKTRTTPCVSLSCQI